MAIDFTPRTAAEIEAQLAASVVARSHKGLSDIGPSADLRFLCLANGEELSYIDLMLAALTQSFDPTNPNISLANLRARMKELPSSEDFLPPSSATATVYVTRQSAATVQILPNGTIFGRADGVNYRTQQSYVFGIGVASLSVQVVCMTAGTQGNCMAGQVNQRINAPSWVLASANTTPATGGNDGESKAQAQYRLRNYWASLSRVTPGGPPWAAEGFTSSTGVRISFAKLAQVYSTPGLATLTVDDGTGLGGLVRDGVAIGETVPAVGVRRLWHEAPATAPIPQVLVTPAGPAPAYWLTEGVDYDSIYERGIIQLKPGVTIPAGATWSLWGYSVRTGVIAELQQLLEGTLAKGGSNPGWIGSGCRVVVQPPRVQILMFDLWVVPISGFDAQTAADIAQALAVAYTQTLAPGEPFYVAKMLQSVLQHPAILNVHALEHGTNTPLSDRYGDEDEVLRATTGTVTKLLVSP